MCMKIIIVGGGPAGMAAAIAAYGAGCTSVAILDRESQLGGILMQCIHNGFGLHKLGRELTGPEYAAVYADEVAKRNIKVFTETTVTSITKEKIVTAQNCDGILKISAKAVILSMGCRERSRGALNICGTRPSGIFSAGTAQKLVNCMGYQVGKRVVILGSGDIGLIMARRMTFEGAKVKVVAELMPYSGGLKRNIVQCLDDYGIPLKLSHTVVDIEGKERVEAVVIAEVGPDRRPIPGTEIRYECDTLLLSCGLLPENELSRSAGVDLSPITSGPVVNDSLETNIDGIFACGNVLHVHDLVDYVSEESGIAGRAAVAYINGESKKTVSISLSTDGRVRYTVPQRLTEVKDTEIYFRVSDVFRDKKIVVRDGDRVILEKKKQKLAPGEMETVNLKTNELLACPEADSITVKLEDA